MTITFQHVIPEPLKTSINPESDIWNVDQHFEPGKHYLIDAQSGKGKSTFVQCIYGIRRDYSGCILVDNKDICNFSTKQLALLRQSQLSILFQDLRLFLNLSARDNITLNSRLASNNYADRVDELAERLKVTHVLEKQAGLLSYGERQRIATIRALVQPYKWILLDEPFSHLDKENTLNSFELIREVSGEQGAGIILTTLGEDNFIHFENHLKI